MDGAMEEAPPMMMDGERQPLSGNDAALLGNQLIFER